MQGLEYIFRRPKMYIFGGALAKLTAGKKNIFGWVILKILLGKSKTIKTIK